LAKNGILAGPGKPIGRLVQMLTHAGKVDCCGNPRDRSQHKEQDQPGRVYSGVFHPMSCRDWLRYVAIAGCLTAGVAHAQPVSDDARTQTRPGESQTSPRNYSEKPSPLALIQERIATTLDAIHAASEAAEEKERAQRDLAAQEKMAKWAKWMFWATFAQACLSIVGIGVILKTLKLNREATGAAIKAAEAAEASVSVAEKTAKHQLRAYISIVKFEVAAPHIEAAEDAPPDVAGPGTVFGDVFRITIRNDGATPASNVKYFGWWRAPKVTDSLPANFPEIYEDHRDQTSFPGGTPSLYHLSPGQEQVCDVVIKPDELQYWRATVARERNLYIFGNIFYRDIYKRPWRQFFCVQWEPYVGEARAQFTPYKKYNGEDDKPFPAQP
jgi:hypothetical protein